ncbi:MAG: hypothetical protein R6V44_16980 [Paracoccaceae bacterium]
MTGIVSGVFPRRAGGERGFLSIRPTEAWPVGRGIARPTRLRVAPFARRLVGLPIRAGA